MGVTITSFQWVPRPGVAYDIGVGDYGASVWAIGSDPRPGGYGIYFWNGSGWDSVEGAGVRIAVGPNNTPWVVNDAGSIFVLTEGSWKPLPGLATDIGVGADGSVWVIGSDPVPGGYGIYYWNGSDWNKVEGGAVRIAVSRTGTPWVVNDMGNIYVLNGGNWQLLPGAATDITLDVNTAWVLGTNPTPGGYGVFYWKNDEEWAALEGGAVSIAAGGSPWAVNNAGEIFSSELSAIGG